MPVLPPPLVAAALAVVLAAGVGTAARWPEPAGERLVQDAALEPRREPVRSPSEQRSALPPGPAPAAASQAPRPPQPAAPVVAAPVTSPPVAAPASAPPPAPATAAPAPAPAPAPPAPAPPAAAPPAPPPASGPSAAQYEDRLVAAVNAERTGRGLPALVRDGCADRSARRQAERMAAAGALSHQDLGPVLDACGGTRAAENVGSGDVTPERLVELWMASEGHRRNVLDPALTHLGSGAVRHADGRWYAAHVFLGR